MIKIKTEELFFLEKNLKIVEYLKVHEDVTLRQLILIFDLRNYPLLSPLCAYYRSPLSQECGSCPLETCVGNGWIFMYFASKDREDKVYRMNYLYAVKVLTEAKISDIKKEYQKLTRRNKVRRIVKFLFPWLRIKEIKHLKVGNNEN